MSHGIDIGRRLTIEEIDYLARSNFSFVGRYVDGSRGANPKCLNNDEVAAILSRRLAIMPVFETTGAGPWDYATGKAHGAGGRGDCLALSMPLGFPLPFAVDEGAIDGPDLVGYFNGVYEGLDGAYCAGVYGKESVVRYCRELFPALGFFWQTYAWSAGAVYAPSDAYQHANNIALMRGQLVVDLDSAPTPLRWRIA